jgi:hypothetical protein
MRIRNLTAAIVSVAAATLLAGVTPAVATEADSDTLDALVAVTEATASSEQQILAGVADISAEDAATGVTVADNAIVVPSDASDPIVFGAGAETVEVTLPYDETSEVAEALAPGVVAFDNTNGSSIAPVIKDDGSIQIAIVVDSPSAPSSYSFDLDIPPGGSLVGGGSEAILILDSEGAYVAAIAPAWAVDANGVSVPTTLEISGTTVTQVVALDADGLSFPVVADPWLGSNLFGLVQINRNGQYLGQNVYSSVLSSWGTAVYTGIAQGGGLGGAALGQQILRDAGWSELKTRLVGSNPATTLKQQYDCHVLGGYAVWIAGVHWDLERARSTNSNWGSGIFTHKCNW